MLRIDVADDGLVVRHEPSDAAQRRQRPTEQGHGQQRHQQGLGTAALPLGHRQARHPLCHEQQQARQHGQEGDHAEDHRPALFQGAALIANLIAVAALPNNPIWNLLLIGQILFYTAASLGHTMSRQKQTPPKLVGMIYYLCVLNLASAVAHR